MSIETEGALELPITAKQPIENRCPSCDTPGKGRPYISFYQETHSPVEHFAGIGYAHLRRRVDTDDPRCPYSDDDPRVRWKWVEERILEMLLDGQPKAVAEVDGEAPKKKRRKPGTKVTKYEPAPIKPTDPDWEEYQIFREWRRLRSETPTAQRRTLEAMSEPKLMLAGENIEWHWRLPELKTWAGQITLEAIVRKRTDAVQINPWPDDVGLLDWMVPLSSCSGMDDRTVTRAIDDGFSFDLQRKLQGMCLATYAVAELLAIIGMNLAPIVRYGRSRFGYVDPHGQWWRFEVVERSQYYKMYTVSTPCSRNGGVE